MKRASGNNSISPLGKALETWHLCTISSEMQVAIKTAYFQLV